ncbi:MAG: DEAD/DEAH box helicase [Verrucomicrobiales bacterium]
MTLDRATLDFLNSFPEGARNEGERIQRDGGVTQIFGTAERFQAKVDADEMRRVTLTLSAGRWSGQCSSGDPESPALVAAMAERIERGGEIPDSPNEVGRDSIYDVLSKALGRDLQLREEQFLAKLEKRFEKYEREGELHDHDLVRLAPRWPVESYEAIELWPQPPEDIVQFWNYIAHALRRKKVRYPTFMDAITDSDSTREQLADWERGQQADEWRARIAAVEAPPPDNTPRPAEARLIATSGGARLQWRYTDRPDAAVQWRTASTPGEAAEVEELREAGRIRFDAASELLVAEAAPMAARSDFGEIRLDGEDECRLLARLFHHEVLRDRILTLDEIPFARPGGVLQWRCLDPGEGEDGAPPAYALQLFMPDGEPAPHSFRLLPARPRPLYLSDEAVLDGPPAWSGSTLVEPRSDIPPEVIESPDGVDFLALLGASLPPGLKARVAESPMAVVIAMEVSAGGASESIQLKVTAADEGKSRKEVLGKDGWQLVENKDPKGGAIPRYDRAALRYFPELLSPLNPTYDASMPGFRARVTKVFPERFAEWAQSLPGGVTLDLDPELQTILADPVMATVRFEVKEAEIDWFDLKVAIDVEGEDLSLSEIKQLVAARGGYVRIKNRGWLRLKMRLEEAQEAAIAKLGLDPFDLSGEKHRMHALQISGEGAEDIFDAEAWDQIRARARSLKLRVQPPVPDGLKAELRPYQVDGFHFLSYLAENRFGGILADDMGLGKTVQGLTWILWLRHQQDKAQPDPAIVVCPKSVLDVWAGEAKKFAPELRVQVLRDKSELEPEKLGTEIDLLVLNYAQLRASDTRLAKVPWVAAILDEGQQIKNPDSKAAKAARGLQAQNRLVLTGTPIENRLLDIWSLMAFAMPGALGNRSYFRERFDRRKDPHAQTRLSARLRPFLLRRTKNQVALDLPPRTEEDVLCEMEGPQRTLYDAELARIQKLVLGVDADAGLGKQSFAILQGLLRLRRICCHPALIDPQYTDADSAKMNALFYLLDQLHEEGHKVLVFSQFVTMLDIIKARLEKENRPHFYLTGQTVDRNAEVEGFQRSKDAAPFLLSLKAGGAGLNLTAASYVILYDPWWNPAVENQAIDRTHRIGQTSKVIAYRLLMRNTVEEKVRLLQQKKTALFTGVLGEESFTKNLKREDLDFLFGKAG